MWVNSVRRPVASTPMRGLRMLASLTERDLGDTGAP